MQNQVEHNDIINRIRTGIKEKDSRAEIFLYGSRARGDNHPDSDWDILVITPRDKITLDYESELRDPILDIEFETGQIISLMVYTRTDWAKKMMFSPFYSNVKKEGIKI
jgi:uncharacterized protein